MTTYYHVQVIAPISTYYTFGGEQIHYTYLATKRGVGHYYNEQLEAMGMIVPRLIGTTYNFAFTKKGLDMFMSAIKDIKPSTEFGIYKLVTIKIKANKADIAYKDNLQVAIRTTHNDALTDRLDTIWDFNENCNVRLTYIKYGWNYR